MGIKKDRVTIQEALDRCLDDLYSGGASIEQCLARYPEHASELRPLLRTAERLDAVSEVRPSRAWKARLRKQLSGEPERPKRKWFGLHSFVLVAVLFLLIASLALWMGINLQVAGGALTPLPPMSNFLSPELQDGVKAVVFAQQPTSVKRPVPVRVDSLPAGARVGPVDIGFGKEMSRVRAKRDARSDKQGASDPDLIHLMDRRPQRHADFGRPND